jgi:hypothetical protein
VTFRPDARVDRAVAANASRHALPGLGETLDENYYVPYGLQGSPVTEEEIRATLVHSLYRAPR